MHTPFISSLQHPIVKHLTKLRKDKSYRQETGRILISGDQVIREVAKHSPIQTLLIEQGADHSLTGKEIFNTTSEVLTKITGLGSAQTLLAEVDMPLMHTSLKTESTLLLDGISDPGNLGTLLRSALAFGFNQVALTTDCCDPNNDKSLRGARGANFHLRLVSLSREELVREIEKSGLTCYCADIQGESIETVTNPIGCILILGHEARGISTQLSQISQPLTIGMASTVESLNVAIAGSILMHQLRGN